DRVVILDTSAFLAGFDPFSISEEQCTVPKVQKEAKGNSVINTRFETAIDSGKLKVISPKKVFVDKIHSAARLLGDSFFLSEADLQLLALALQLRKEGKLPLIATDDYSIQNVADQMSIEYASSTTFGIRFRLKWRRYCPACWKQYPADFESDRCEICGTKLKRKPATRRRI
ncbi:MAG: ribonuclease VapC, partial [Candidatus Korarchaeota archaeon]|nr:ribonuclease VapC [Candidatus Korarchaeota archaeon]NIW13426.1 ribonuclease VapC [Candidatus Thorarchaeota archaeon]